MAKLIIPGVAYGLPRRTGSIKQGSPEALKAALAGQPLDPKAAERIYVRYSKFHLASQTRWGLEQKLSVCGRFLFPNPDIPTAVLPIDRLPAEVFCEKCMGAMRVEDAVVPDSK